MMPTQSGLPLVVALSIEAGDEVGEGPRNERESVKGTRMERGLNWQSALLMWCALYAFSSGKGCALAVHYVTRTPR